MTGKIPHLWKLIVIPEAKLAFDKLSSSNKDGIFRQLQQLLEAENPYQLPFVKLVQNPKYERARRFRVGDDRVLFSIESEEVEHQEHVFRGTLFVIKIGDRKNVY